MKFRDLTSEEIEVRVQSVVKNDKGVILLLYKDARVDQNILDESITPKYWQKEYYEAKGILFCKVGINVGALTGGDDTWVWKADCGSESNIEAQKGEASDAFKRACFNWGIGRELYTAPFIYIPADKCNISNGKCFDKFMVERIKIVNKHIVGLSIINLSLKTDNPRERRCFVWKKEASDNG